MLTPGYNRINATIRFNASFKDSDGVAFDPDTLTAKILSPSDQISTFTYLTDAKPIRTTQGAFYLDFAPTEAGRWHIRWAATEGEDTIILEDNFIVQVSPFVSQSRDYS